MHALIMAGGSGSRLNLGEKPLILICGRPMISYVIAAFSTAGFKPVVVVSPNTPMTMNWCRANGITVCKAGGSGYIEDMISAVRTIDMRYPIFISVADIPCVTPDIIRMIAREYYLSGKDGCSTWIPARLLSSFWGGMPYRKMVNGNEACPVGINILRGDLIDQPQDELQLLLDEPDLFVNVNTLADRNTAEYFLKRKSL